MTLAAPRCPPRGVVDPVGRWRLAGEEDELDPESESIAPEPEPQPPEPEAWRTIAMGQAALMLRTKRDDRCRRSEIWLRRLRVSAAPPSIMSLEAISNMCTWDRLQFRRQRRPSERSNS
jgi:hypothetical protein